MMIVKERRISAVFAAFAWIALIYLWQADVLELSATIDSPQASHIERTDRALAGSSAREEVTLATARHAQTRE